MRFILRVLVGATVVYGSACALAGPGTIQPKTYYVAVKTTKSEVEVKRCANLMAPQYSSGTGSISGGRDRVSAPIGPGWVSNRIDFSTKRVGDETLLRVSGDSFVFPDNGIGDANTNEKRIPATPEVRAKVNALVTACA